MNKSLSTVPYAVGTPSIDDARSIFFVERPSLKRRRARSSRARAGGGGGAAGGATGGAAGRAAAAVGQAAPAAAHHLPPAPVLQLRRGPLQHLQVAHRTFDCISFSLSFLVSRTSVFFFMLPPLQTDEAVVGKVWWIETDRNRGISKENSNYFINLRRIVVEETKENENFIDSFKFS